MEQESLNQLHQNSHLSKNQPQNLNESQIQTEPAKKIKKMRGPPKGSKRRPNLTVGIKTGLWNINQMKAYLKFITRFVNHFRDKATRKKKKIFHRMSNFIKSRTAQQCRSHHQKLEIKFVTHQKIIEFIEGEIQNILKVIQMGRNGDECGFQQNKGERVKVEEWEGQSRLVTSGKVGDKKTDLREAEEFYELVEGRNGLVISIEWEQMQIWS